MKYRTLGNTGVKVSEIGFGGWAIGGNWGPQKKDDSLAALHTALDAGVNFIDTAQVYGDGHSERLIAEVLNTRREEVFVATKTPPLPGPWPPSPYCDIRERYPEKYLRENIEARLRNLQTDTIDLLQLHTWTRAWNTQPYALDVLKKLQQEGKIRYIGISTPEMDQNSLIDLMRQGYLDTIQLIYNIFEQEPATGLLPEAKKHGVGVIVRVAFDEGVLTGKYSADMTFPEGDFRQKYFAGDRLARAVERVEKLRKATQNKGYTLPQLALKFVLAHPAVSLVIPGMRKPSQAEANTTVSDLPDLPQELLHELHQHYWMRSVWYHGK